MKLINKIVDKIFNKNSKLFDYLNHKLTIDTNHHNFINMMKFIRINKIKGDYAEFGVYKGNTFIKAFHMARISKTNINKFYAFDSFEGLPAPKDTDTKFHWGKGDYAYSLYNFNRILIKNKVDITKVKLVKGFYEDSLKKTHGIEKLAAVHIDCDLYESTNVVFNYIKPYLQNGTIILFNDWYCFNASPEYGEQKAFNEFKEQNKNFKFIELPTQGFEKMFAINIMEDK